MSPISYLFFALLLDRRRGVIAMEAFLQSLPVVYLINMTETNDRQFRADLDQLKQLAPEAMQALCTELEGADLIKVATVLQAPNPEIKVHMQKLVTIWGETIETDF